MVFPKALTFLTMSSAYFKERFVIIVIMKIGVFGRKTFIIISGFKFRENERH